MGKLKNLTGIYGNEFQFGADGPKLVKETDGMGYTSASGATRLPFLTPQADGTVENAAVNYRDQRDNAILIEFAFAGATPPDPGDNTGKYGFCHTDGGDCLAGEVYHDDGTTLRKVAIVSGMRIATNGDPVIGTVELEADAIYVAESATAPYNWALKLGAFTGVSTEVNDLVAWADIATGTDQVDRSDLNTKVGALHVKLQAVIDALQAAGIVYPGT